MKVLIKIADLKHVTDDVFSIDLPNAADIDIEDLRNVLKLGRSAADESILCATIDAFEHRSMAEQIVSRLDCKIELDSRFSDYYGPTAVS